MKVVNAKYFEKKYDLKEREFHLKVKKSILKYAHKHKPKEFYKVYDNPDIGLDKENRVFLISRLDKSKSISLDVNIITFIPKK